MRSIRRIPGMLALALTTALTTALALQVSAQETLLQNDGFFDGQPVGFQGGFVAAEIAASRFTPVGTGPWQLKRVQFLLGGSTSTVTVTVSVYSDAAGTTNPGTELWSGDFLISGSDVAMQEVDLTADNVIVSGQFRVGIEFQHDGFPSVARDGDGTITANRNFIYTPSAPGWFQSSLFGLTGDWVIRAVVQPSTPGGGTSAPDILTIADVGNDQGRQVRVRFARASQDSAGAATPVLNYELHRRVSPQALVTSDLGRWPAPPRPLALPLAAMLDGWDYVLSVPAHGDAIYSVVAPTLVDSSIAQGMRRSVFFVRATTAVPTLYFDSPPDSGYSVDNLPPAPPAAMAATYSSGATHLLWNPNAASDLWYYALHRGATAGFTPNAGNRIAATGALGHDDIGPAGSYYKLAAIDVNGNTSGYTLITPATASTPGSGALALSLALASPNPSRGSRLSFALTLPDDSPARLELLDVHGRRMTGRDVSALGAGRHTVDLSAGAALHAGVYLARLTQGVQVRVVRAIVME